MTDPQQVIAETCRCGGSINITASLRAAQGVLADWRANHPCTSQQDAERKGATGGGSTLGFAVAPRQPWGHNNLDVRA